MQKLSLITIIFCLFGSSGRAQTIPAEAFSFSLQQSLDYAMVHQSAVMNAQLDEQIAQQKVKEILANAYPQISGSFQFQDFLQIPTSLIPGEFFGGAPGSYIPVKFGTQYNATAGITANQLIADGQFFIGVQAVKALTELSQKNTERTGIETKVAVTKAYYSVLVNEKRIGLLDANVERLKKLKDDTKALFENGFVEKIDFDRVSVGYNNLMTEKDKVTQLVSLSYYLLKFQMGMDVNTKLTLTDSLSEKTLQGEDLLGVTFNPQNRVEFQMLQTTASLYQLDIKRNKVAYLPGLYAFGNFSTSAQRPEFTFFNNEPWYSTAIVGLQLNVPIFDGFAKSARIQQGKLNLLKNQNDMLNLQNAMQMQVNSAKIMLANNIKSLNAQKDNMKLAEDVYNAAKKKYDAGVGSNLEVVNAETDLKTAQSNYLNSLYDAWVSKVDLMQATGTIK